MSYKVKLRQFEGPFDLLVYLIEHSKMSIYDIQISEITAQYLQYIEEMKRQDTAVAQEFMVLAAELIELKSRMLLPSAVKDEQAAEEADPRKDLVERILEYKRYKAAAAFLSEREEFMSHVRGKPREDLSEYTGEADEILKSDTGKFVDAFRDFLFRKQKLAEIRSHYQRTAENRMSIEGRIAQIRVFFQKKKTVLFSEMLEDDDSSYGKVLTFVSMLELIKQRTVTAEQKKRFGDISFTTCEGDDGKA